MSTVELLQHREILLARARELESLLRGVDITIESTADPLDEVQRAAERELAIENADRESGMLADVRLALQRIRDGSYGVCVECDEAIAPRRLSALPWASRCIRCQEALESAEADASEGQADAPELRVRLRDAA